MKKKQKWEPFQIATLVPKTEAEWIEMSQACGVPIEKLKQVAIEELEGAEIWKNNLYQVVKRPARIPKDDWPAMIHLSIRRLDRHPLRDWRHFQRIKNELVGPNHEGIEIYPNEDRLVDTANEFHLWVFKSVDAVIPVGYFHRMVTNGSGGGAKQRKRDDDE